MNILITGAKGFVGTALTEALINNGDKVTVLLRNHSKDLSRTIKQQYCNFEDITSLSSLNLSSINCVIHLAARAHVMKDSAKDPLAEYRLINTDGTLELAKLAGDVGVKRFIYLSSVKVNGELTSPGKPFSENDFTHLDDPYAISKYEAEIGLLDIAAKSDMEVVIIRPPLVYGPNVKGNFASMISWVKKGIPLPFGLSHNNRSLIALENLVGFILLCADHDKSPNAANQVFLISDGEDVSTTLLLRKVAHAYDTKSFLFPIPTLFMRLTAKIIGKNDLANRLLGNLQIDSSKARKLLGWKPIVSMDEQLIKMAEFDKRKNNL